MIAELLERDDINTICAKPVINICGNLYKYNNK